MIEDTPKSNKLIAVYARVSTANQEEQQTINTQLSAIEDFALKNGYTIVQRYKDDGWSGDSLIRPALDQLRVDAKKKAWEAVLFYDPDRLARRYSYQELVMDELRESSIEPLFVTIPPSKNSEDRLMYGVRGVFAEYERVKIAERFRLGKLRKAKEGHVILSEAPYGYNFVTKTVEEQGYLEINKREAQIVKNIFLWVADEGLTLRGVVKRLQELSIPPRKSKRGVWSTSTLSTLLRNKTYIGQAHYGASYAVVPTNPFKKEGYKKIKKTSRRMKPEDEWIPIPVTAIIDEDLFMRAGTQLETNFALCQRNKKNEYLLAGKIWCSCGIRRAGEGPQRGKHLYYRCSSRVHKFPLVSECSEKGVNARIADGMVWQHLEALMSSPELLNKEVRRWAKDRTGKTKPFTINITETQKEIAKLKEQEGRYAKAYGAGALSLDQLKEYSLPIREKVGVLEEQMKRAQLESKEAEETPPLDERDIENFAEKAGKLLHHLSFEHKRAIVMSVIEKVIGTKEKLHIYGSIPVTNVESITIHRYRRFT